MIEVGRNPWRSSGPTLSSSRATQTQLPGKILNISKNGDSTTSLVACASAWSLPPWKECFLVFRTCFTHFTTEKSLMLSFPFPHFTSSSETSLLQTKQSRLFQPFLVGEISNPIIISVAFHCTLTSSSTSLLCWGAQNCSTPGVESPHPEFLLLPNSLVLSSKPKFLGFFHSGYHIHSVYW